MSSWYCVTLCVAILVVTSGVLAQNVQGPTYDVLPASTAAVVGHSVTIYCSIANLGRHQVFWNINQISDRSTGGKEFTLGPDTPTHSSYPRFAIVGNTESGEYNLRISNVSKTDVGVYICLVQDPVDAERVLEAHAELTVVDTAEPPEIGYPKCTRDPVSNSRFSSGVYIAGDILTLTCTSKGGVPLSELSWKRVNFDTTVNDLKSITNVTGDWISTTAKITLTSADHQSYYKCIETHPARPTFDRTCTTPFSGFESLMDVRFKPEVTITPSEVNIQLLETTKVTLSCIANANPALTIQPVIILPENKTGVYPRDDKTLVEVEMTIDDVGMDFICTACNVLGCGEDRVEVKRSASSSHSYYWSTWPSILKTILITSIFVCFP